MISVLLEFLKTTLFIAVVFARLVLPDILRRANYAIIKFIYRNIRVTPRKRSYKCCYLLRHSYGVCSLSCHMSCDVNLI